MKKLTQKTSVLIILFLLSIQIVSAQKTDTTANPSSKALYDLYMYRHQTFKTVGWILLAPGTAMFVIGLAQASSSSLFSASFTSGALLFCVGGVMVLGSIPCFIISGSSHRKAILQLKTGNITSGTGFKNNYVGLSLKINL